MTTLVEERRHMTNADERRPISGRADDDCRLQVCRGAALKGRSTFYIKSGHLAGDAPSSRLPGRPPQSATPCGLARDADGVGALVASTSAVLLGRVLLGARRATAWQRVTPAALGTKCKRELWPYENRFPQRGGGKTCRQETGDSVLCRNSEKLRDVWI